jgi:hypothetical protein
MFLPRFQNIFLLSLFYLYLSLFYRIIIDDCFKNTLKFIGYSTMIYKDFSVCFYILKTFLKKFEKF